MKIFTKKLVNKLIKKKLTISTVESCTGGLLSSVITSVSGSSKTFKLGLCTYSNLSKINILKISKENIKKNGSVSKQVCLSMLKKLSKISKSDISIAITGIAGPKGGNKNKPVGLVFVGIKKAKMIAVNKYIFKNKGRLYIQKEAVKKTLKLVFSLIK